MPYYYWPITFIKQTSKNSYSFYDAGMDIFNMMNLSVPANVSRLEGWAIMIYPNSTQYKTLVGAFDVSRYRPLMYYILRIHKTSSSW